MPQLKRPRYRGKIPSHTFRQFKFLRWEQLPTTDPLELLQAMCAAIGYAEAARRLAREDSTVRGWVERGHVPKCVYRWLILAAANRANRKDYTLAGVRWHYPKRHIAMARVWQAYKEAQRTAEQLAAQHLNRHAFLDTLAEPLD